MLSKKVPKYMEIFLFFDPNELKPSKSKFCHQKLSKDPHIWFQIFTLYLFGPSDIITQQTFTLTLVYEAYLNFQ